MTSKGLSSLEASESGLKLFIEKSLHEKQVTLSGHVAHGLVNILLQEGKNSHAHNP